MWVRLILQSEWAKNGLKIQKKFNFLTATYFNEIKKKNRMELPKRSTKDNEIFFQKPLILTFQDIVHRLFIALFMPF